jgi:hypothetical protein
MVGRWGSAARRLGKAKTAPDEIGPGIFRSAEPSSLRAVVNYFSAALRAVFRFRRRASAAFKALASLGFT